MSSKLLLKSDILDAAHEEFEISRASRTESESLDAAVSLAVSLVLDDAISMIDDQDDRERLMEWFHDVMTRKAVAA